jgi:hypothetical protein
LHKLVQTVSSLPARRLQQRKPALFLVAGFLALSTGCLSESGLASLFSAFEGGLGLGLFASLFGRLGLLLRALQGSLLLCLLPRGVLLGILTCSRGFSLLLGDGRCCGLLFFLRFVALERGFAFGFLSCLFGRLCLFFRALQRSLLFGFLPRVLGVSLLLRGSCSSSLLLLLFFLPFERGFGLGFFARLFGRLGLVLHVPQLFLKRGFLLR